MYVGHFSCDFTHSHTLVQRRILRVSKHTRRAAHKRCSSRRHPAQGHFNVDCTGPESKQLPYLPHICWNCWDLPVPRSFKNSTTSGDTCELREHFNSPASLLLPSQPLLALLVQSVPSIGTIQNYIRNTKAEIQTNIWTVLGESNCIICIIKKIVPVHHNMTFSTEKLHVRSRWSSGTWRWTVDSVFLY